MNAKSFLAALAGTVIHFFLGYLIYGLLLADFLAAHVTTYEGLMVEGSKVMVGYALSSFLFAILLTYVLQKSGARSSRGGLVTSAVVSLLMAAAINVSFYFGMNIGTGLYFIVDAVAFTVMGSLTGLVIGAVLSRSKSAAPAEATMA